MKKPDCTSVLVTEGTIQKTLEHLGHPMVCINIRYPVVSGKTGKRAQGRINRYCLHMGKKFLTHCNQFLLPEAIADFAYKEGAQKAFNPFKADMCFTVTYNDHGILSLYWDVSESIGSVTPGIVRYSDTWRLQNGFFLTLPQLYPRKTAYRSNLLKTILEQAEQDPMLCPLDGIKPFRKNFSPRNFYITNAGLSVFYQMHTIAPHSFCTFSIPYSQDVGPFPPPHDNRLLA